MLTIGSCFTCLPIKYNLPLGSEAPAVGMYAVQTLRIIVLGLLICTASFPVELLPPKKEGRVHRRQVCLCFVGGKNQRFEWVLNGNHPHTTKNKQSPSGQAKNAITLHFQFWQSRIWPHPTPPRYKEGAALKGGGGGGLLGWGGMPAK